MKEIVDALPSETPSETAKESAMDKKGSPAPAHGQSANTSTTANTSASTNTNPAPNVEAALLALLQRLNSTVQTGRPLSDKANAAIANFRAISLLLNTSPLLDDRLGAGGRSSRSN
jgi:hypothetical protein